VKRRPRVRGGISPSARKAMGRYVHVRVDEHGCTIPKGHLKHRTRGYPPLPCGGSLIFASKREWRRWRDVLKPLYDAGTISELRLQVSFPLIAEGGVEWGHYIADAVYVERGELVVEDSKGLRTAEYKLKARAMKAQYNVTIREV
jgi:hypothetical protein